MKKTIIPVMVFAVLGLWVPGANAESVKDMLDPMISSEPQDSAAVSAPANGPVGEAKPEKAKIEKARKAKETAREKIRDKAKEKKSKKDAVQKGSASNSSKLAKTKKQAALPQ